MTIFVLFQNLKPNHTGDASKHPRCVREVREEKCSQKLIEIKRVWCIISDKYEVKIKEGSQEIPKVFEKVMSYWYS